MNIIALGISLLLRAASADQFTLHFVPSPAGVDWTSPQSLAYSVVKNQVARVPAGERHEIGHVYVELNCGTTTLYTGMTSVGNDEERNAVFKQGYGLGILFKTFVGELQASNETAADIKAMQTIGRPSFARFLISSPTCKRLAQYLVEFKANHYDQVYAGLNARPLKREGSGCAAFGASFLELAGLQTPDLEKSWTSTYIVPWKYIGGPMTGAQVSIVTLLTAFNQPWSSNTTDGYLTHFWNPEQMNAWTRQLVTDLNAGTARRFPWPAKTATSLKSVGIEFDARLVPTPTSPIFQN